jgi:hypothetical protein
LLLFVPFFTAGNYDKLFFTGPGELLGFIVQGGNLKGCTLIFYFFIVEGEGFLHMYGVFFMVPSLEMWKEEGGKGLIGFSGNVFFSMERVGGYYFYKLIMGGGVG